MTLRLIGRSSIALAVWRQNDGMASWRSFLRQRAERLGEAALNFLPSQVTRAIDQARHKREMQRLYAKIGEQQVQLDEANAEIDRLKHPGPGEVARRRREDARQDAIESNASRTGRGLRP